MMRLISTAGTVHLETRLAAQFLRDAPPEIYVGDTPVAALDRLVLYCHDPPGAFVQSLSAGELGELITLSRAVGCVTLERLCLSRIVDYMLTLGEATLAVELGPTKKFEPLEEAAMRRDAKSWLGH